MFATTGLGALIVSLSCHATITTELVRSAGCVSTMGRAVSVARAALPRARWSEDHRRSRCPGARSVSRLLANEEGRKKCRGYPPAFAVWDFFSSIADERRADHRPGCHPTPV